MRYEAARSKYTFVHIKKTGGISLQKLLAKQFGKGDAMLALMSMNLFMGIVVLVIYVLGELVRYFLRKK